LNAQVLSDRTFGRAGGITTMCTKSSIQLTSLHLSLPAMLVLLLVLATGGHAHGGHMDKIPEGAAVSDDPIVCLNQEYKGSDGANPLIRRMASSGRTSCS
jgi:hypothetical protein